MIESIVETLSEEVSSQSIGVNGGSKSMLKLKDASLNQKGIGIFFTPRGTEPLCNSDCKGCYFFENFEDGQEPIPAGDVPDLARRLQEIGYRNIFPISTELLLAPNHKDIIKATGDKYVNTNGKLIAIQGQKLLHEIADAGIEQIVITANITESHEQLQLTPKNFIEKAFQEIKGYNSEHPEKPFKTVATIILTSENYDKISEMVRYVYNIYGANGVKFISYIPMSQSLANFSPTLEQLAVSIAKINETREQYDPNQLYIQRGGTIGSQGLSDEKLKHLCPAGDGVVAITSTREGASVTPCIYIKGIEIGKIVDGNPVIDAEKLGIFRQIKEHGIASGYCPAHGITTRQNQNISR